MGIKEFLFGEEPTQEQAVDLAPTEFKGIRPTVGRALTGVLKDQPKFEGPFAAALGDTERTLASQAVTQAQAPRAGRAALTRTLSEGGVANPFLAAGIEASQRPIEEQFEVDREILRGAFARSGQRVGGRRGSSQFKKVLARTGRAAAQKLGAVATQLSGAEVTRRRTQQQAAIATSLGVDRSEIENISLALEAAGVERETLDAAISRAATQDINQLNQLLDAIRVGGAAGKATIVRLAAVAPGDGALSDIAGIVGGVIGGPVGAQIGQAIGQSVSSSLRRP